MSTIRRLLLPAAALLALAAPAAALADPGDKPPQAPGPGAPYRAAVMGDSPRAYWRFDEQPGPAQPLVAEDQRHNFPAYYEGSPLLGVPHLLAGDSDGSLDLDGLVTQPSGQDVHAYDGEGFKFDGRASFSVEAWVRPRDLNDVTRRIASKEGPDGGWLLGVRQDGLVFSRHAYGAWTTLRTGVDAHDWTYVVATYDGCVMRVYVNGWLAAQDVSRIELPSARDDLFIGSLHGRWRFYAGGLDELAIYPYALSYGRVLAHWRVGAGT